MRVLICGRVVDLLETGREGFPFIMPEISMPRAGGDDEIVVRNFPFARDDEMAIEVDIEHSIHEHGCVLLPGKNAPDRCRDLCRRKTRGRDLVQQWLEEMIIAPVNHGHIDRRRSERLRGIEPAKTGA